MGVWPMAVFGYETTGGTPVIQFSKRSMTKLEIQMMNQGAWVIPH
jgi:hypothetical protein